MRRGLPEAQVLRSGMGAYRARSTARVAARIPADAVAVAGFCGAVTGGLRAGDVVVAGEVRGPAGVTACESASVVAALCGLGIERVHVGPLASVDHLVRGAERAALAAEGALAADMESAWLATCGGGQAVRRPARRARHAGAGGPLGPWSLLRTASPPGGRCDARRPRWRSGLDRELNAARVARRVVACAGNTSRDPPARAGRGPRSRPRLSSRWSHAKRPVLKRRDAGNNTGVIHTA